MSVCVCRVWGAICSETLCVCVCTIINYAIVPFINFVYITLDLPQCSVCIKVGILMRSGFINSCD